MDGALPSKTKELITVAVAHVTLLHRDVQLELINYPFPLGAEAVRAVQRGLPRLRQ